MSTETPMNFSGCDNDVRTESPCCVIADTESLSLIDFFAKFQDVTTGRRYDFNIKLSNQIIHSANIVEISFKDPTHDLLLINVSAVLTALNRSPLEKLRQLSSLSVRHKCTSAMLREKLCTISPTMAEMLYTHEAHLWYTDMIGFSAIMLTVPPSASINEPPYPTGTQMLQQINEFILTHRLEQLAPDNKISSISASPLPTYNDLLLWLNESRTLLRRKSMQIEQMQRSFARVQERFTRYRECVNQVKTARRIAKINADRWLTKRDKLQGIYEFLSEKLCETTTLTFDGPKHEQR